MRAIPKADIGLAASAAGSSHATEAANALHASLAQSGMPAEGWNNLLQSFSILPASALSKLKLTEILGYTSAVPVRPDLGSSGVPTALAVPRRSQSRGARTSGRQRRDAMLYMVHMRVEIPATLPKAEADRLKAEERAYAQTLQREGKWRHLWRVAGQYANYSVFDVSGNDDLHDTLMSLPLYPYMSITVTPLAQHPSAIATN